MNSAKVAAAYVAIANGHAQVADGHRQLAEAMAESDAPSDVYTSAKSGRAAARTAGCGVSDITITLPPECAAQLEQLAAEQHDSVAGYVARVVEAHVATQTGPHVRARKAREARSAQMRAANAERERTHVTRDEQ